ncbi:MAG: 3-oxoadipate enol-lactonase, partial [Roseovarius sp.]|nr:3-oxoadipate enol-lactonase [Roseovarius sp.]
NLATGARDPRSAGRDRMTLTFAKPGDVTLHYHLRPGAPGARPVVFLNSLGTDFRIWQGVVDRLGDMSVLMMDKRGHGLSDAGEASIAGLAGDVSDLMDHLGLSNALICGVSVGGMIAQALAAARPDLVAGLVLCNTGAKIGDAAFWNARIETVQASGLDAMADAILERWFSPGFRANKPAELAGYRNMLSRTTATGYAATCAAIRDADLRESTRMITVPTTCIGGTEDLSTPPDLVTALAGMIPDATLTIIDDVGHLPCIEAPEVVADEITTLWKALG